MQLALPYAFFMLLWAMDMTAIPGFILIWWMQKNQILTKYFIFDLHQILKSQWVLSLIFIFCFLLASQMRPEVRQTTMSDDHFIPILLFLPAMFAFGIKLLAIISLMAAMFSRLKKEIKELFFVPKLL